MPWRESTHMMTTTFRRRLMLLHHFMRMKKGREKENIVLSQEATHTMMMAILHDAMLHAGNSKISPFMMMPAR